ncbi:MAG: hypothetical protein IJ809_04210 [Clostridia bacterium]|nr:hypothetical protein [Clostridia bacterium]
MKKEKVVFENDDFNGNTEEVKREKLKSRFVIGVVVVGIIIVTIVIIIQRMKIESELYEATTSEYEVYQESKAYVITDEKLIDYDKNSTIITLAEGNKRIAVGNIIAMYKTTEYDSSMKKIKDMDAQINEKIATLPVTYSVEIVQVENDINDIIQKIKNTTSYIEINEYKTKLDDLAYKKAKITASLTPSGSDVLELIEKRDAEHAKINSSSNNIKSTAAGVVVYKTDGLEGKYTKEDITKEKINEIMQEFDKSYNEEFGIKIVDNFESFMIVEDDIAKKEYMQEGKSYIVELIDKDTEVKGVLYNIIEEKDGSKVYCVFRITNGVEHIADCRTTTVKVIWKRYTGFWVNNTSVTEKDGIYYVKILSLNEYIDIPVKVIATSDEKKLVNNYTKSELENLGIERKRSLILYDRIVKDVNLTQK